MSVLQLALGVAMLACGSVFTFGRRELIARRERRGARRSESPMFYVVIGSLLILDGILQVVSALRL